VFDGFLCTPYHIAELNGMPNFKNVNHKWYSFFLKKEEIYLFYTFLSFQESFKIQIKYECTMVEGNYLEYCLETVRAAKPA